MKLFILFLVLLIKTFFLHSTCAVDFIFNGFNSSSLLFHNSAFVQSGILSLTNESIFSIGRALFPHKIPTKPHNSSSPLPFSTSFIFSIAPTADFEPGHGFVFLFAPSTGTNGTTSSQHLGLFNRTNNGDPKNHVFGIEFDVFQNPEFNDLSVNHVGVDVNSLTSIAAQPAGYWPNDDTFEQLSLPNGENYQVWIDYLNPQLLVTMAPAGMKRPMKPLLNISIDLSEVLLDEMHVGFTAATGQLVESHRILGWSFSNSNFSISEALITKNLPSFVPPRKSTSSKRFIIGIAVGCILVIIGCCVGIYWLLFLKRSRTIREEESAEAWEQDYWPHRITYQEIHAATNGFAAGNLIGSGGSGKVYKGFILGGSEIAVKCISQVSNESMKQFAAEVLSLGRLKHKNLVGLRGWCKKDKHRMILVYDYMENGSLDKRVFECEEDRMISSWRDRIKALKDVASGVLYLHEGWESRVLHRDIKASNVLLDKDMNAKLGDFGLARIHGHGNISSTSHVMGTAGYLAPELVQTGRASAKTDVFSYGVLVLEVLSGRRPIEHGKPNLVEWTWELNDNGELMSALDERVSIKDDDDDHDIQHEELKMVLHLGLLCAHPEPSSRPTMRQVLRILEKILEGDKVDVEEKEEIFDKLRSTPMWSKRVFEVLRRKEHPTFGELQLLLHSSMSFSDSDIIQTGR
ncbi:hypothetical protein Scep_011326 [Stephania cephalantha]|uniref:non-specific serine/threonine protein kinase n=1 Tax=Stephania cephalantha TaxID=152367 RepID=A0AAP0P5R6_9MAGN